MIKVNLAPIQSIVGICKQNVILIVYQVRSMLPNFLTFIYDSVQVSNICVVPICCKFTNFVLKYYLLGVLATKSSKVRLVPSPCNCSQFQIGPLTVK